MIDLLRLVLHLLEQSFRIFAAAELRSRHHERGRTGGPSITKRKARRVVCNRAGGIFAVLEWWRDR
jgi:hypothetical protein